MNECPLPLGHNNINVISCNLILIYLVIYFNGVGKTYEHLILMGIKCERPCVVSVNRLYAFIFLRTQKAKKKKKSKYMQMDEGERRENKIKQKSNPSNNQTQYKKIKLDQIHIKQCLP
jgi:hypothetical protein